MQVKLDVESLGAASETRILVNGQELNQAREDTAYLMLSNGDYHVQF
jgi:hypothetical protein